MGRLKWRPFSWGESMDVKQKEALIERRLRLYDIKIFELEMDRVAAEAVGDREAIKEINRNLEALHKAREAVKNMISSKEGDQCGNSEEATN